MQADQASVTAHRVALRRAVHQWCDTPRILNDPLAERIIGEKTAAILRGRVKRHQSRFARALRAFLVVRSRYAEDNLADAVTAGVRQYLVLGAGLDTSAYRQSGGVGLSIFEVDHPATQKWKSQCLVRAGIVPPAGLTYVPVDFEKQSLQDELVAAGFSLEQPVFVSWLGVTPYLTDEAFMGTVRFIGSLPKGTTIVFDYARDPKGQGWRLRLGNWLLARRVAKAGEPFRSYFVPEALAANLRAVGFSAISDLSPAELNEKYFRNRTDGLHVIGLGRLMKATV